MSRLVSRCALAACLLLLLGAPGPDATARANDLNVARVDLRPSDDSQLTGRDIYKRVLENTFQSFIKTSQLLSGDRGGNEQISRFKMWYDDVKGDDPKPGDVVSKTLVKYTYPFDIRYSGYLVLSNYEEPDDQFLYMPSQRRVKRVSLRGEAVFGSDFSFEDILPRELEDATYERKPDETCDGVPCFVIEAVPAADADSEYSKMVIYVEKARFLTLRVLYWDDHGVPIKELHVDRDSVEQIKGVWVPHRMEMRHLKHQSYTQLTIEQIEANVTMPPTTFDLRRLESH